MENSNLSLDLGDISFDLVYGTTFKSGLILSGGILGSIPTATGDYLPSKQLQLGPNALIGIAKKFGVIGVLGGHKWGVTGPGTKVSSTVITVLIVIPVGDRTWQINSLANYNSQSKCRKRTTMDGTY